MRTKKNGCLSIQGDHDWLPISLNNHEPVQYYFSLLSIKDTTLELQKGTELCWVFGHCRRDFALCAETVASGGAVLLLLRCTWKRAFW